NLVPDVVDAQNARAEARLRLRSLAELPLDAPLVLTTGLEPTGEDLARADALPAPDEADEIIARRPSVRAAAAAAAAREAEIRIARAAWLPTVEAFGTFGQQAFPKTLLPRRG